MPDAARIAQAQALEVPIVLRGAKQSDDAAKPELFTETARTVLVFENGLVLHLHSKLTVGQTIFIHNTQNGREVLCKVLEAPAEGELGLTDLEFTKAVPDFWDANSQGGAQPADDAAPDSTTADEQPVSHVPSGAPSEDPLAMMLETASKIDVPSMSKPGTESGGPLREELMPAHEMAPDPSAMAIRVPDFEPAATTESSASSATEPTGEQIDAALKEMSARAATPLPGADADHTQDEKHIAALMERDARLAKFAAFKEKQAEKIQKDAATKGAAKGTSKETLEAASDAEVVGEVKPLRPKLAIVDTLTTGKNATYVTIAIAISIGMAIGFIWHSIHATIVPDTFQPAAVAPATPSVPAASAPASSAPAQPAAAPPTKASPGNSARVEKRVASNRGNLAPDDGAGLARSRRQSGANTFDVPARVLSQPQPTLPPWAVDVQVDGVVTLDVTIGENGSVVDVQVISGPRPLQREAERAVGLWQFEPARANGKPVESHMTLSVEFLPPPPPKRIY